MLCYVEARFIISHFYSEIFVSRQCKSAVLSLKQCKACVKFMQLYLAQTFQKKAVRWVWALKTLIKMLLLSINTESFLIAVINRCCCFKWIATGFVFLFWQKGIYLSHWKTFRRVNDWGSERVPQPSAPHRQWGVSQSRGWWGRAEDCHRPDLAQPWVPHDVPASRARDCIVRNFSMYNFNI